MKKVLKIILWISSVFIVLLIIGVIVLKIRNSSFISLPDKEFVDYLNNNKTVLDGDKFFNDSTKAFFDESFYKSQIILLGENHGYAEVQDIDKSLFIYLNKNKGTRYYIAEMDSLVSGKLNTFLMAGTKDTILLKEVVAQIGLRIPQQAGHQLFVKWSDIYDYNRNLPDSLKIIVLGVDKNIDDKSKISRDEAMMNNFSNIVKNRNLENESFYGLFGLFHVLQSGINKDNQQYFAARLKSSGYNIKSILCMDIESEVYMPKNNQYPTPDSEKMTYLSMDGPILLVKGINDLKKASAKNTITLFNIEKEDSPYWKSNKLTEIKMNFFGQEYYPFDSKNTSPYFAQYILFLRNATAISPLK